MRERKIFRDLSANTVQTVITQLFGLSIFYFTSKYLVKEEFGELNWLMAVGATIIAIASLGLDLVFVKKIASGESVFMISGIHFFHTLLIGSFLCILFGLINFVLPEFSYRHPFFLLVFLSVAIANIANSFKLCLSGLESYKHLALIAFYSNVFKFLLILLLYFTANFKIITVIFSYMGTSILEFLIAYYFTFRKMSTPIKPIYNFKEYRKFIILSLPQLGVVVFDSALARLDWILLGIISTASITAEYSFVYKVFELSKLPLLIIAPVLLTRFSKIFGNNRTPNRKQENEIKLFFRIEFFVIMLIPLVLVSCWSPVIDFLTNFKYGKVNEINYTILAFCIPMACLINFFWTIGFVLGQMKTILFITMVISTLNVLANVFLIPLYGALGASSAFLICTVVQFLLYFKFIKHYKNLISIKSCLVIFVNAIVSILLTRFLSINVIFITIITVIVYICLNMMTRQISIQQVKQLMKTGS